MSLAPLSHVSSQVIDIYYIISVAGTTVFPGYEGIHKDEKLWEVFLEVEQTSVLKLFQKALNKHSLSPLKFCKLIIKINL